MKSTAKMVNENDSRFKLLFNFKIYRKCMEYSRNLEVSFFRNPTVTDTQHLADRIGDYKFNCLLR